MKRVSSVLGVIYIIISVLVVGFLVGVECYGEASMRGLFYLGPGTHVVALTVALLLMWLLVGCLLLAANRRWIRRSNVVFVLLFFLLSGMYLSFLREHQAFGDYDAYLQASRDILTGNPFNDRYIYPPLWASILAHIAKAWSFLEAEFACFALNNMSIMGFFVLGALLLRVSGLSLNLAAVLMFVAMLINAPLLRNIVYIQVNFILLDLILAALLLCPQHLFLSAFFLGLGIHLKVVPIFFVPIFAWLGRTKWLVALMISMVAIFLLSLVNTPVSYYISFIDNLSGWSPTDYRACSIYGFLYHLDRFAGLEWPVKTISHALGASLLGYIYYLCWLSSRRGNFVSTGDALKDRLLNGSLPAFFIITVVSPTVWVHHLVLLIIPSLFIMLRLLTVGQVCIFCVSWFFLFWLPVFDCYPWSYMRMLGWILMLGLLHHVLLYGGRARWVADAERRLMSLLA